MKHFKRSIGKNNEFLKYLIDINKKGWLDEFSDNHFIIKAINGEMDYFNKYRNLTKRSMYYSYTEDNNCTNFILNFFPKFQYFCNHFKEKDCEEFVKNQLSAGKSNYMEEQFFRAMSEINIINFLISFGPAHLIDSIYEPKLGINGSNPEARLVYSNGITVDVEVKTPGFNKKISGNEKGIIIPTFLLEENEKEELKKICNLNDFKFILPRVGKLKDYINSAGKKFQRPKDKNHVNLLFINWTYTDVEERGYLEPYSLLYNNLNGILKNKEMALEIGIDKDALEKISAIIVYQDSFDSIIFGDFRYAWNGYKFRMLPNMLIDNNLIDVDTIKEVTRMNPPKFPDELMPYEIIVNQNYLQDSFKIAEFINTMIKTKVKKEDDNFTYFTPEYFKKQIEVNKSKLKNYKDWIEKGYLTSNAKIYY
ncbi:hypothetical protein [Clostridium botulinum]|uniref:hypothetical protein n=1 Tax=Clostridium botulinum TaxID=1491 RepID=UPI00211ADB25|nr:hypothetical protein [Clostridium botulinum]